MKLWAFNRRLIDDQRIWVRAPTLADAWRLARKGEADETGDPEQVRVTLRRLPAADEGSAS